MRPSPCPCRCRFGPSHFLLCLPFQVAKGATPLSEWAGAGMGPDPGPDSGILQLIALSKMAQDGDQDIVLFAQPKRKQKKRNASTEAAPGGKKVKAAAPAAAQPAAAQPAPSEDENAAGPGPSSESLAHLDTFKTLGLTDWLCSVCQSLGMSQPTQVQQGCIPAILRGKDVIGLAQTGSGKTAAFALPILQTLAKDPFGVFALVLTPTR